MCQPRPGTVVAPPGIAAPRSGFPLSVSRWGRQRVGYTGHRKNPAPRMQSHDPDERYAHRAVLIMLSLALFASLCATLIHWFSRVHRPLDMIVPPGMSVLMAVLIVALLRRPQWVLVIARTALLAAALALAAPAWFYTLQAALTPGERLITVLPPVSSLFVVLMMLVMVFTRGRRAFLLVLLGWALIALPVLVYLFAHPGELLSPRGRELAMAYGPATVLAVVLLPVQRGMVATIKRLSSERARMEVMLHRDALTGIHNRRLGQRVLQSLLGAARSAGVIMLDLDHFKAINDTYGHPAGDRVLQTVASRCRSLLREDECLSRWGGEEFLVVLPDIDANALQLVAERLQMAIAHLPIGAVRQVTASFGATMIGQADTLDDVLQRADRALYKAKARGGNCVVQTPADRNETVSRQAV